MVDFVFWLFVGMFVDYGRILCTELFCAGDTFCCAFGVGLRVWFVVFMLLGSLGVRC